MAHRFEKSVSPRCPEGYILRDSYTTKNGTYVPARCIKKTTILPEKAKLVAEEYLNILNKEHKNATKIAKMIAREKKIKLPKDCPEGEILRTAYIRDSYTRSNGTKVKGSIVMPDCIKNRGAPGKGKRLIVIEQNLPQSHILSKHGYHNVKELSKTERHTALKHVLKSLTEKHGEHEALIEVIRQLIGRANLSIRTNPKVARIFKDDADWISEKLKKWKEDH